MRALAIFFGLWAGLALSATEAPVAEAKGFRRLQYTVKEGDTIYDLARRFGCTVRDLERSNEIGEILPIGKKLRIPACGKTGAAEARLEPRPHRASGPRDAGKRGAEKLRSAGGAEKPRRASGAERPREGGELARMASEQRGSSFRRAAEPREPRRRREAPERRAPGTLTVTTLDLLEEIGQIGAVEGSEPDGPGVLAAADRPAPLSSIDPTTGSIAQPAAAPARSSSGAPVTEPAAAPGEEASAGAASGAQVTADLPVAAETLVPNLPRGEDEADGPSDHKLVLDGRQRAREVPRDVAGADDAPLATRQSIGRPWRGRLQSAARLGYGEGYVLRRPNRTYGTRTTVAHVERALAELRHKFPRLHTLAVGDLSLEKGGPVSEHRSHQSGRDIDLGLCFHEQPSGYPESFVVATESTLDAAATWALISALADTAELDGGLEVIFLDFAVQGMVYRWALDEGIDSERLDRIFQYPHGRGSGHGLVRHAPNHADHLHARFSCAAGETGCR